MDNDLRDLLRAWLSDSVDESRSAPLLTRLREDANFREAFVAEITLIGQIKALQETRSKCLPRQRRSASRRCGWYPNTARRAAKVGVA